MRRTNVYFMTPSMKVHSSGYVADVDGTVRNPKGFVVGSLSRAINRILISLWDKKKKRPYKMHRAHIIWEAYNGVRSKGMDVDHINGNSQDDRLENLRLVSHSQNLKGAHTRKTKGSPYRGVYTSQGSIVACWVGKDGRQRKATRKFKTFEDAAVYRDKMAFDAGYPMEGLNFPEMFFPNP